MEGLINNENDHYMQPQVLKKLKFSFNINLRY